MSEFAPPSEPAPVKEEEDDESEFRDTIEEPSSSGSIEEGRDRRAVWIDENGQERDDEDATAEDHFYEDFDEASLASEESASHTDEDGTDRSPNYQIEELEEPEIRWDINVSRKAKDQGNEFFREKRFSESIECYSEAIHYCPKDEENIENLATFYGNRSASYFNLDEFERVVEDCTEALALKEDYVKVLARRMQAYEKIAKIDTEEGKQSTQSEAISSALSDAKRVQELDPSYPKIDESIARIQADYDEKMVHMKDEALGTLKNLGEC